MNETTPGATLAPNPAIPLQPLGVVKNLADTLALDITYVYEDLIFVEHNAFLLQMSRERGEEILVWFNTESTEQERTPILVELQQTGRRFGLLVYHGGTFSLAQDEENQSIQLEFHTP